MGKLQRAVFADRHGVDEAVERFVELTRGNDRHDPDTRAIERELDHIDATVNAVMISIDPANLPLLNKRLTQLRQRKDHLQAELRAARTAARDHDGKGLRRWAQERIGGLAAALAGRRNEQVRRVLTSYVEEIVIYPSTKKGVMRINPGLAALIGDNGRNRNANDWPRGRSQAGALAGAGLEPATSGL